MELTEQEIKILIKFAKYLNVFDTEIAEITYVIEAYSGIQFKNFDGWQSSETGEFIESYSQIDKLIEKIINDIDVYNYFSDDNDGYVIATLNTNDKTLSFSAGEYATKTNNEEREYNLEELENEDMNEWFAEMQQNGIVSGVVTYNGGGDEGYIEGHIDTSDGGNSRLPAFVETWILGDLDYNWYDNEGGQGEYEFFFTDKYITGKLGTNYQDDSEVKIPIIIKF
jgi:hypothetical protein